MSMNKNSTLAFVVGAALGSAVALLLAPAAGDVTRQRIRDGGARIASKGAAAVDSAKTAVEGAGHSIDQARKRQAGAVSEAFAAAKETYVRETNRT